MADVGSEISRSEVQEGKMGNKVNEITNRMELRIQLYQYYSAESPGAKRTLVSYLASD